MCNQGLGTGRVSHSDTSSSNAIGPDAWRGVSLNQPWLIKIQVLSLAAVGSLFCAGGVNANAETEESKIMVSSQSDKSLV